MTLEQFLSDLTIKPATFRIGGQWVENAILDFNDVTQEMLIIAGIKKILIELQNNGKRKFMVKNKKIDGYEDAIKEYAAGLSNTTIQMYDAAKNFTDWDFDQTPGEGKDKVAAGKKLAKTMTDEERAALIADLQAQLSS